jgi:AcrR family transcriptional regulator
LIDAASESFWRAGYTRTNVDGIAARACVTKRTLYSHFRSKDELLEAVLGRYHALVVERLQRIGERMPADPTGMIASFFDQLAGWASVTPRWSGSGITRLAIELGDLPGHPARTLARRSKAATEAWLAERLAAARISDASARARDLMLLMEGAMVLTLIHGDRTYFDAAARAAARLVQPARRMRQIPSARKASARKPAAQSSR